MEKEYPTISSSHRSVVSTSEQDMSICLGSIRGRGVGVMVGVNIMVGVEVGVGDI
jgi:ribose 5-phosphate isomerase RpiB